MATNFVTFCPTSTSTFFICKYCWENHEQQTHIVGGRESFQDRQFTDDGLYTDHCIFKNVVNVRTIENPAADIYQEIRCLRCNHVLGSKYVQLPPLYAHHRGSFYLVDMENTLYWDGNNKVDAEAGLAAMLAEPGQGPADPVQNPGLEAQLQPNAHPVNQDEDAEAGLPAMLAEPRQGPADPVQDLLLEAQLHPNAYYPVVVFLVWWFIFRFVMN